MKAFKIVINDFSGAPFAEHNMPCPILGDEHKAVLQIGEGYFKPSWRAQALGWETIKIDSRFKRKLVDWFFK